MVNEVDGTDEDSFAELANQYSDDAGSNTNGGLYEDVYKNQMVAPAAVGAGRRAHEPGVD